MTNPSSTSGFSWQHYGVMGLGVLVFVLLLFADKTNLNNNPTESVRGSETVNGAPNDAANEPAKMSVNTANPALQQKISELEAEANADRKVALLKEIVEGFQAEGNSKVAAAYAGTLADLQPNAENYLVAGALHRFAAHQPDVMADSIQFKQENLQALNYLQKAVELEPKNEGALIELGLAYIESGEPGSGMTGIMKLREVTEINPKNVEATFHLGKFSFDTGQFDKAVSRFETVLELEPENMLAKYYLGLTQHELGNRPKSKEIMEGLAQQSRDSVIAAKARSFLQNN